MKIYYYLLPSQFPQKTPDQKCLDLTNFTTNYTIDRENPLDSDLGMAKNVILVTAINRFWEYVILQVSFPYTCIGIIVDPQGDKKAQGLVTIKDE